MAAAEFEQEMVTDAAKSLEQVIGVPVAVVSEFTFPRNIPK